MGAFGPPRTELPRLTDRLPLGTSGLRVSPACLGMVESPDAVRTAFECGVNFFFITADMHWPYYDALRRGLGALLAAGVAQRADIVVAAVSYVAQPEFGWVPFQEVLDAVPELEYLDVLVVGGAYEADLDTRLAQRREQLARGYLGAAAVGVTLHERRSAVRLVNDATVDIAYLRFNPAHPGARDDVFPHLKESRTLVFNFKSASEAVTEADRERLRLDQRFWLPAVSDYYRFALQRREVDGVLCSPSTPDEVLMLRDALERGPLSSDQYEHLVRLADLASGRKKLRPA
jgi:hypothetical protein